MLIPIIFWVIIILKTLYERFNFSEVDRKLIFANNYLKDNDDMDEFNTEFLNSDICKAGWFDIYFRHLFDLRIKAEYLHFSDYKSIVDNFKKYHDRLSQTDGILFISNLLLSILVYYYFEKN